MQIERVSVDHEGIIGTVFSHKEARGCRGLVVVSGSEGGIPEYIAHRFVKEGWVVFALGYFGAPGLPKYLEEIPLEYFVRAVSYFRDLPQVNSNQIGIIGNSRGAEPVLLLASQKELQTKLGVKGVCALVPSCYVTGGFPHPNKAAWTLNSEPVAPFVQGLTSTDENLTELQDLQRSCTLGVIPFHQGSEVDPYCIADLFLAREKKEEMEIPIENISMPLLLIASEEDKIWPSKHYLEKIVDRIGQNRVHQQVLHHIFLGAGHGIAFPYFREYDRPIFHPIGSFWCTSGGDPIANEKASRQTVELVMSFFEGCTG